MDDLVKLSMVLHRITSAMVDSDLEIEVDKMKQAMIDKGVINQDGTARR